MQRVERHIRINDKQLDDLCFKSKNLYNYCNYLIRQEFIETHKMLSEYKLTGQLSKEKQFDYKLLPAQTAQQVIKVLFKNWKSFFRSCKEYKKNPSKYKAPPKMPYYKHKEKGRNVFIFTNQQVKLKDEYIYFPKMVNLPPLKTKVDNVCQVRIVPQYSCFIIEVVYKKEVITHELNNELHLSIDIGVNNAATCVNDAGLRPFIINGRPLKSMNQYFNKKKAKLMSFVGDKGTSRHIQQLTFKRNQKVADYLHKTSRIIINYCIENKIGHIIIGHNKDWKQEVNIGKRNNQNFVSIPMNNLIQMISYKGEENGIKVSENEESYTSKIDHLALEAMEHQEVYLGKRIKRGLFQSSTGVLLNADVNGGIGIMRKAVGDGCINLLNRGCVSQPVKWNII